MRRLIIRPGAIGDCILALPAMEALRAPYTEVWVARPNVPLIRFADRVRAIADTGLDLLGLPGVEPPRPLIDCLAAFDSIVSWYGSARPELRDEVRRLGLPFQFFPALPDGRMHAADFFLAQVGAPGPGVPQIRCPRVAHDFAVIHPFSAGKHKTWPLERFRAVARAIEPVRWCAGPDEALEDAVRFDDLYQLACWLAGARVFVGNDSGIAHLAAAAGAPVVAIFGPTDPAIWAPRGDRVRIVHRPSLDEVPVEDVMDAAIGVAL